MKNLGPFVILLVMVMTWMNIHNADNALSYISQASLQSEFKNIVIKKITDSRPEARSVEVKNIWSELVSPKSAQLYVTYQYDLPSQDSPSEWTHSEIQATAKLIKDSDTAQTESWRVESFTPTKDIVAFSEGLKITPQSTESDNATH